MARDTITFVCTGNTCRSPMAAKLMEHALKAEDEPLRSLKVVSAGLAAGIGMPMSTNSQTALKNVKIEPGEHSSQPFSQELLDQSFAVFGMTSSHVDTLLYHIGDAHEHIYLMRDFLEGSDLEIPDPFGQTLAAYEATRDSMVESIPSVLEFLRKSYKPKSS